MKGRRISKEELTPGGFEEMSYVTRFMPTTSFVIREDIRRSTSGGKTYLIRSNMRQLVLQDESNRFYQSAVMKSSVVTARRVITCE